MGFSVNNAMNKFHVLDTCLCKVHALFLWILMAHFPSLSSVYHRCTVAAAALGSVTAASEYSPFHESCSDGRQSGACLSCSQSRPAKSLLPLILRWVLGLHAVSPHALLAPFTRCLLCCPIPCHSLPSLLTGWHLFLKLSWDLVGRNKNHMWCRTKLSLLLQKKTIYWPWCLLSWTAYLQMTG